MKPPRFGSAKPYHQDNYYFECEPADDVITCWIALEKADKANGCLRYISGSHRLGIVEHSTIPGDPNESNLSPSAENISRWTKESADAGGEGEALAEVAKGGLVLHHSQTLHCSYPNESDRWRRAYATHWVTPRVTTTSATTYKAPLFKTPQWAEAVRG